MGGEEAAGRVAVDITTTDILHDVFKIGGISISRPHFIRPSLPDESECWWRDFCHYRGNNPVLPQLTGVITPLWLVAMATSVHVTDIVHRSLQYRYTSTTDSKGQREGVVCRGNPQHKRRINSDLTTSSDFIYTHKSYFLWITNRSE